MLSQRIRALQDEESLTFRRSVAEDEDTEIRRSFGINFLANLELTLVRQDNKTTFSLNELVNFYTKNTHWTIREEALYQAEKFVAFALAQEIIVEVPTGFTLTDFAEFHFPFYEPKAWTGGNLIGIGCERYSSVSHLIIFTREAQMPIVLDIPPATAIQVVADNDREVSGFIPEDFVVKVEVVLKNGNTIDLPGAKGYLKFAHI